MHRFHPIVWLACALALAAFAPARHLAAQAAAADSIATIDLSQLGDIHLSVVNQDEVARAMARHVAHIGNVVAATVKVSFVIDENGRTRDVHADPTSGFKGVDRAAEGVVKEMRFTPPVKDGHPVRVRISMPISFAPDGG
ncbi:MAG TPA: energy transducer TonB [Longimicrobium sp.]|nr:energy transducer TonB [Longimicrobium sp.]